MKLYYIYTYFLIIKLYKFMLYLYYKHIYSHTPQFTQITKKNKKMHTISIIINIKHTFIHI